MTSISFIVTCQREKKYIRESVNSVLQQKGFENDIEVIVVACNTDKETLAEIPEDAEVIEIEDKNISEARNIGASQCSGDYIFFQDADDISAEDRVQKSLPYLETYDIVGQCLTTMEHINSNGEVIRDFKTVESLRKNRGENFNPCSKNRIFENTIILPSTLACKKEFASWNKSFPMAEDFEYLVRHVKNGADVEILTENLCSRRMHEKQVTNTKDLEIEEYKKKVEKLHNLNLPSLKIQISHPYRTMLQELRESPKNGVDIGNEIARAAEEQIYKEYREMENKKRIMKLE